MESLDVIVASLEREMAEADARFDTVHEHIAVVSKAPPEAACWSPSSWPP